MLPEILCRIRTHPVLRQRHPACDSRRPNCQCAAKCAKFHGNSPYSAAPTTNSCRSILFHKYPPAFQTGSSGCTLPFASVARTAIEYFPAAFGVHGRSHVRNECAPKSSPNCAGFHVCKLSSEISTFDPRPYPLNAIPRNVTLIPAGIFPLPSGATRNDRTGICPIGSVFTPPALIASGVVVPRGVSGIRYAVFIQKFSSILSSTRIQARHFIQYVAKYPGTTSRTGNPFSFGSGSPFIAYATKHSSITGLSRSSDFRNDREPIPSGPSPCSNPCSCTCNEPLFMPAAFNKSRSFTPVHRAVAP